MEGKGKLWWTWRGCRVRGKQRLFFIGGQGKERSGSEWGGGSEEVRVHQ